MNSHHDDDDDNTILEVYTRYAFPNSKSNNISKPASKPDDDVLEVWTIPSAKGNNMESLSDLKPASKPDDDVLEVWTIPSPKSNKMESLSDLKPASKPRKKTKGKVQKDKKDKEARKGRVSFSDKCTSRSWKASMKGLGRLNVSATSRIPGKSILVKKKL